MGRAIMIQGTSSGAGKSTLVTGLCRVLKQEGFSVAPFKAQNMSSNAYYLENGLQMAKSQAIAAYACGIEPDVNMNPVLLKPTNLAGSEVILNGEPIGYSVSYTHLRAHETGRNLVCRLLLEKKKNVMSRIHI